MGRAEAYVPVVGTRRAREGQGVRELCIHDSGQGKEEGVCANPCCHPTLRAGNASGLLTLPQCMRT